jgi:hypothetical protein
MIRLRHAEAELRSLAAMRRPLTAGERAWADLVRAREAAWEREVHGLAADFEPVAPPARVEIVLGNRGGSDAFVSDPVIGFDLAALHAAYGAADLPENADRIDRLFRHEYVHLLQKAWLRERPYATDSPLRAAVAEIWAGGWGTTTPSRPGGRRTTAGPRRPRRRPGPSWSPGWSRGSPPSPAPRRSARRD